MSFAQTNGPISLHAVGSAYGLNNTTLLAGSLNGQTYTSYNGQTNRIQAGAANPFNLGAFRLYNADNILNSIPFNNPYCVTFDNSKNMYVADSLNNRICIQPYGSTTFSVFAGGTQGISDGLGTNASFYHPNGIVFDPLSKYLYVADNANYTIRRIDLLGNVYTLAGKSGTIGTSEGQGSNANFWAPNSVAVDSLGNIYVADTSNNKVRKITPSGMVSTVVGGGAAGGTPGVATGVRIGTAAVFNQIYGIAIDLKDNIFITDTANTQICKITNDTVKVTTFVGGGASGIQGSNNGTTPAKGSNALFASPRNIVMDSTGNIYVTDTLNCTIRKIDTAGNVTIFAGGGSSGIGSGNATINGSGSNALFSRPEGIAIDTVGNLYVTETGNYTVRKITPAGLVSTLAGGGTSGSQYGNNGTGTASGTAAFFTYPAGIDVDSTGNIYVGDQGTIRMITPAGVVSIYAGGGATGIEVGNNGTGTAIGTNARFSAIYCIKIDLAGNLYVTDTTNNTISKIDTNKLVTIVAGGGSTGSKSGYIDGSVTSALFYYPEGMVIGTSGTIYVTEYINNTIRKISNGIVTTIAGVLLLPTPTVSGASNSNSNNGTNTAYGLAAYFKSLCGILLDSTGNLYICDSGNNTIRKMEFIDPIYTVNTLAGGGASGSVIGSNDGIGTNALFTTPWGVITDPIGNIYVSENSLSVYPGPRIRKITPLGVVTSHAGGGTNTTFKGNSTGYGTNVLFNAARGMAFNNGSLYVPDSINNNIRKIY